ncbi:conserved hypothetical protein [Deferribacter desulfuricans SSM1]|uniref:Purine nucleoside phosphorylase n=1 Tax=Deferribacter desulfuricans (strain DSM 14783 / JCM 11476 / NBRC 101012 / SSM1) TaxID=639282 RepID=D3PCZ3_DEFDS|nr:polyphenol oxidase family protein [Deferribacter desulfuricans]BAI80466.1 conserved hypothetical protein [Deferribacter desulfuricans SSM1]
MQGNTKEIPLIKPENIVEYFNIFTTTRFSGVSDGPYKSFNFGYFCEDDLLNVEKNYKILKDLIGISRIVTLRQVHGSNIIEVKKDTPSFFNGDGLFSKEVGIGLGILTADCYSVQIIGENGSYANLHCGWKSVFNGIVNNAIKMFGKEDIRKVYINVGICKDCFEVKGDFINYTKEVFNIDKNLIYKNGKYFFDLRSQIEDMFLKNGIEKNRIEHIRDCSYCNKNFYSYRRDKVTGRMISVISRVR